MRFSLAVALACTASVLSVEAAGSCSLFYNVIAKDTCAIISSKTGVTVSKLKALNTGINSGCTNLKIGEKLCLETSATTTKKTNTKKTSTKKTSTKKTFTKKTSTKKTTTKKTSTKKTSTKKTTTKKTTTKKTTTTKKSTTTKKTSTTKKATTTTTTVAPALSTNGLNYYDGLTVKLNSAKDFCLFLPSSPGGKADNNNVIDDEAISKSEKSAVAFCLKGESSTTPGARTLPTNFIDEAYFYRNATAGYVQVTGTFRPETYQLSTVDGGGQYDNHGRGSPANSMCYGYKYFVSLIEPDRADYCIRCCNVYEDCNAGRSSYGCRRVVQNGVYDD